MRMPRRLERKSGSLWFSLLLIVIGVVNESRSQHETVPVVTIPQGTVQGLNMMANNSRNVFGFLGIPYARPPIGNLRFKAPLPASSWNGTYNANNDGSACPQVYRKKLFGDEDCLSINVFTPQLPGKKSTLLPTMFYIYGGQFKSGSHDSIRYGPEYMLNEDVVLAVPNYRVGPLGFLTTGDEVAPGNFGLKDLVLALKWVQDNIRFFGGDPNRVTIFGQSSGASVVHLLSMSDSSEGLFHSYIMQSGTAFLPGAFNWRKFQAEQTYELGKYFNCSLHTSRELVECLRKVDALEISDTMKLFYEIGALPEFVWLPTDEPDSEGAFLTDSPQNLIAAGKLRDLPCIIGVVADEGLFGTSNYYANLTLIDNFISNMDELLPYMAAYYRESESNQAAYTAALKDYYLNDLTVDKSLMLKNLTLLLGDANFNYPAWASAKKLLEHTKSPVWFYLFNYLGVFSYSYIYSESWDVYGVAHGDDIIYRFPQTEAIFEPLDARMTADDMEMVDIAVQLWTTFATTGEPTCTAMNNVTWEPYSAADPNYLQIGNGKNLTLTMSRNFLTERMEFWEQLYTDIQASSAAHVFPTAIFIFFIVCLNNLPITN